MIGWLAGCVAPMAGIGPVLLYWNFHNPTISDGRMPQFRKFEAIVPESRRVTS